MESPEPNKTDSRRLMRLAKGGDRAAFAEVYDRYFTPVYRYIFFRVRSRAEAEDLTQAVFLKAYEAIERFEDRGKEPLAYFFTIARNAIINFWRKKKEFLTEKPEHDFHERGGALDIEDDLEVKESVTIIRKGLSLLTDEQAEVISLKFISELSNKEIAEALGKSEEAVRQLQSRGLRELRKHLSQ